MIGKSCGAHIHSFFSSAASVVAAAWVSAAFAGTAASASSFFLK